MSANTVMLVTGVDRPGVMDDVSLFLHDRGVKILDIRVSNLCGQFALLLMLTGNDSAMTRTRSDLYNFAGSAGVQAELHPAGEHRPTNSNILKLNARGKDQDDALHRIGHLMRVLNVNIDSIETRQVNDSGEFDMEVILEVPQATPVLMLKQYVQGLASEIAMKCEVSQM